MSVRNDDGMPPKDRPGGAPQTLKRVAEHLHDGVYFATVAGVVVWANEACLELLGVSTAAELPGRTLEDLWLDASSRGADRAASDGSRIVAGATGDDLRVTEYRVPHYDGDGDCIGYLGVLVREDRAQPAGRSSGSDRLPEIAPALAAADPRRGCLVFQIDAAEDESTRNSCRDLAHLIVRLTRPEDLVAEVDVDRVVLFAEVSSPAALKAIAERVVARGRREVSAAFSVGVAIRAEEESSAAAIERAATTTYLRKRRLRGRVAAARSGPHRAA